MKMQIFRFCLYLLLTIPLACTYDQLEVMDICDDNLVLTISDRALPACGVASGSFLANVSGGTAAAPILYSLNGIDFQESPSFNDLEAGNYTLTAQQGICMTTLDVLLENSEGLNAAAATLNSDCGGASGEIVISTSDASGAISYSLNGGPDQSTATFSGLAPGDYQVVVADEIGCQVTLEVSIASTVEFTEIQAIVTATCAVSGCHAGNVSPDFRNSETIVSRAGQIASRTGNTSMPPASSGRSLTESQINAIACWVEDGAPN